MSRPTIATASSLVSNHDGHTEIQRFDRLVAVNPTYLPRSKTIAVAAPTQNTPSATKVGTRIRLDIQGLRAIAVALVVAYHLWPERLTGGFVGVDVFFVISGFLITSHLITRPPMGWNG